LGSRKVIVPVAVRGLVPRTAQVTLCLPPAATVGTDCDATVGFCSRSVPDGVKLTATEKPLAAAAALFVTVAVAVKVWPREMLAGTPVSASAGAVAVPLLTVTLTAADVA